MLIQSLTFLSCIGAALPLHAQEFQTKLATQAEKRTLQHETYDGSYRKIPYPGGDVPAHLGVCTDVVIRSYRALGIDLQQQVHEDMRQNFAQYPQKWGLRRPDTNIDHRRVPNLQVFFARHGTSLPISAKESEFEPGEIITWDLGGGLTHIGILVPNPLPGKRPWVVHNIGAGPKREDVLFEWKITGRYRYSGSAPP